MSEIVKKRFSKQTVAKVILASVAVLLVAGYLIWDVVATGPITGFLNNREKITDFINSLGVWGPLVFILIQILQTVIAPIPGQVSGFVGGYIFGWWGVLWSLIGNFIGFTIVIAISRKYGRPLLEKIFKKDAIRKFDFAIGDNAAIILFLIFLLPGLPDDMACYMAGLTNIPFKKLLLIVTTGRIPSIVINNYLGSGLNDANLWVVGIISVVVTFLLLLAAWKREKIIEFLKSFSHKN